MMQQSNDHRSMNPFFVCHGGAGGGGVDSQRQQPAYPSNHNHHYRYQQQELSINEYDNPLPSHQSGMENPVQPQQYVRADDNDTATTATGSGVGVVLMDLIVRRRFAQAMQRVREVPSEAQLPWPLDVPHERAASASSGTTNLALHEACRHRAPVDLVRALLQAYGDAVSLPGDRGYLPLHFASCSGASPEVVAALIVAYPSATRNRDNPEGRLPLHLAAQWGADEEVIMALLMVHPRASTTRDASGKTPLDHARISSLGAGLSRVTTVACGGSSNIYSRTNGNDSAGGGFSGDHSVVRALKRAPILIAVSKAAMHKVQYESEMQLKDAVSSYEERMLHVKKRYDQDKSIAVALEADLRKELWQERETNHELQNRIQQLELSLHRNEHELVDTQRVLQQIQRLMSVPGQNVTTMNVNSNNVSCSNIYSGKILERQQQQSEQLSQVASPLRHQLPHEMLTPLATRKMEAVSDDSHTSHGPVENHNYGNSMPLKQPQHLPSTNQKANRHAVVKQLAAYQVSHDQQGHKFQQETEPYNRHQQQISVMQQHSRHLPDHAEGPNDGIRAPYLSPKSLHPPKEFREPSASSTSFSSKKTEHTMTPKHSNVQTMLKVKGRGERRNVTDATKLDSVEEGRDPPPCSGSTASPRSHAVASVKDWFATEAETLAQSEDELLSRILASETSFGGRYEDDEDDGDDDERQNQEVDDMVNEMERRGPTCGFGTFLSESDESHIELRPHRTSRRSSPRRHIHVVAKSPRFGVASGTDTSTSIPNHRMYDPQQSPTLQLSPSKQSLLRRSKAGQKSRLPSLIDQQQQQPIAGAAGSAHDSKHPVSEISFGHASSSQSNTSRSYQQQEKQRQRQRHMGHPQHQEASPSVNRNKDMHQLRLEIEQRALQAAAIASGPPQSSFSSSISTRRSVSAKDASDTHRRRVAVNGANDGDLAAGAIRAASTKHGPITSPRHSYQSSSIPSPGNHASRTTPAPGRTKLGRQSYSSTLYNNEREAGDPVDVVNRSSPMTQQPHGDQYRCINEDDRMLYSSLNNRDGFFDGDEDSTLMSSKVAAYE